MLEIKKKERLFAKITVLMFGGEEGIRTLDTLTTYTRFPIVRFRPAQPPLHDGGAPRPFSKRLGYFSEVSPLCQVGITIFAGAFLRQADEAG